MRDISSCMNCGLCNVRDKVVAGKVIGDNPTIMIIGEAPGREENLIGEPFVGNAGKLLDLWIDLLEIKSYYKTNVVKCFPNNNGKIRPPENDEIERCSEYLRMEIDEIKPKYIITLGKYAMRHFFPNKSSILNEAGNVYDFNDKKLFIMAHPSYFLRNPQIRWQTMLDNLSKELNGKPFDTEDSRLVLDLETTSKNPKMGKIKRFGCYSYKLNKKIITSNLRQIQSIIDEHDVIIGYNIKEFDKPYLEEAGITIKGQILDLMEIAKKRQPIMKEDFGGIYSLNNVCGTLGLGQKNEIPLEILIKDINTIEEQKTIDNYLKQDIFLHKRLYEWFENKFAPFKEFISDAAKLRYVHLTTSPASYTYKALCYLSGIEEKYADDATIQTDEDKYEGGFVLEPTVSEARGNIYCFDFSSAYPHAFMMQNLYTKANRFHNCSKTFNNNGITTLKGSYCACKMGKLEKVLERLQILRKKYKFEKDDRQYACKIISNVAYGISGNPKFLSFYDLDTATDCTATVRGWIKFGIKSFASNGYDVLYSDSVGKDSLIRTNIGNYKIEELFNKGIKEKYEEKEKSIIENIETLTLNDEYNVIFDNIKSIIRHKTKKKIYKIHLSNQDNLIITEDHSLIWFDDNGKLIEKKVKEMSKQQSLFDNKIEKNMENVICLKNIPIEYKQDIQYTKELLIFFGYWIGDGSYSGEYYINIATGLDTKEFEEKILKKLNWRYSYKNKELEIAICNRHMQNEMKCLGFIGVCKTKQIPEFIFKLTNEEIGWFLNGLFSSDGYCSKEGGCPSFVNTNEIIIKQIRELLLRLGIQTTLLKESTPNVYKGKISKIPTYSFRLKIRNKDIFKEKVGFLFDRKQNRIKKDNLRCFAPFKIREKIRKKDNKKYKGELVFQKSTDEYIDLPIRKIIKIEEINYDDYVYDIEMENTHRFFANDILVHNTDSIFLIDKTDKGEEALFGVRDRIIETIKVGVPFPKESFNMGLECRIKAIFFFKDKNDKEKKKNYIYIKDDNTIVIKGLQVIKRNCTEVSKKVFEILKPQIKDKLDVKFNKKYLRELLEKELKNDLSLACVTFKVGNTYKNKTSIQAQIYEKYGMGNFKLIRNKRVGVGSGIKLCKLEDAKKLAFSDLDLDVIWNELRPFIKEEKVRGLGDWLK